MKNSHFIIIIFIVFLFYYKDNIKKEKFTETEKSIDCEIDLEVCNEDKNSDDCKEALNLYNIETIPNNIEEWCKKIFA